MPYPYTWKPSRVYTSSAANVKVLDSKLNPAQLSTPVAVNSGVITFTLANSGTYFIETTDVQYKETARIVIDPNGINTSSPQFTQITRNETTVGTTAAEPSSFTDVLGSSLVNNPTSDFRRALDALTDSKYAPIKHATAHGNGGSDPLYNQVNLRTDFGAKGDGTTDDTVAWQNFVTYVQANHKQGVVPAGNYRISASINFSTMWGWSIIGHGVEVTKITMTTPNIPIFNLGVDTASYMHSFEIRGFTMDYSAVQTGNTNATPMLFSTMAYEGAITDINFAGGYYGIKIASGIGGPWGMTFDNLRFTGNLTGGAMDWSLCVNAVPNNRFGRIFVDAKNMTKTIFDVRGYNWQIDVIEIIAANNGPQLFKTSAGSKVVISSIKLENGTYNPGAGNSVTLFDFQAGSVASIGNITISGNNMYVNSGTVYVVGSSGGSTGSITIDYIELSLTTAPTGTAYVVSGQQETYIGSYVLTNATGLQNSGSSTTAETLTVRKHINGHLSADKGNADYTVALGDPNVIAFQTAFTAPHVLTLPATATTSVANNLFNGLYFEVVVYGAALTATNTLTVKNGTTTLNTFTADKFSARYTYRRNGWVLTRYNTLP